MLWFVWTRCTKLFEALTSYTCNNATVGGTNLSEKAFVSSCTLYVRTVSFHSKSCNIQHCQDQRVVRYCNFPDIRTCILTLLATSWTDLVDLSTGHLISHLVFSTTSFIVFITTYGTMYKYVLNNIRWNVATHLIIFQVTELPISYSAGYCSFCCTQ